MHKPGLASQHDDTVRTRWVPRVDIEHLWLAVPVMLVVWFGFIKKLQLLDFWWHLKAGEIIVREGAIPDIDLFSFTAAGKPFVLQNWLAEVAYYLLYQVGGFPLLVTANTAVLVAALVPIYHLCLRASGRLRIAVVSAIIGAMALIYLSHVRSQIFSFVFFAGFYWVLDQYRDSGRDRLWLLPLMMIVWVNLHGAFVLGLGLIAIYLVCESTARFVRGQQPDTLSFGKLRKLGLYLILTLVATVANPKGFSIWSHVMAVARDPVSQSSVLEWQPPRVDNFEGIIIFYGAFFITVLILIYSDRKKPLTEIALVLVFSVFGLTAIRNGVWFSLISAPVIARHLAGLDLGGFLSSLRRFQWIDRLIVKLQQRQREAPARPQFNLLIACFLLLFAVLLSPWVYPHLGNKVLGSSLLDKKTPVGVMDFIESQQLKGNIFHPQIYGDYLIWRLWPDQRSFFDGRVHVFGSELARDYTAVFRDSQWEALLSGYDIRYLLLNRDDERSEHIIGQALESPNWKLLYQDELSILLERVS